MKRTDRISLAASLSSVFALAALTGCSETSGTASNTPGGSPAEDVAAPSATDEPTQSEPTQEAQAMSEMPAPETSAAGGVLAGLSMPMLDGTTQDLSAFAGKPVLVVNTASKCGYTPQYDALQAVHEKYADQGLVVVGFPSGDFGGQEFDSGEEIVEFCRINYGVTFPLAAKSSVKGASANPLFARLIAQPAPIGGDPKWNFTKFLISPEGEVVARYDSSVKPDSSEVTTRIESLLGS